MIKKYYVQMLLLLSMASNQVAQFWAGNKDRYEAINGDVGYELRYHYWVVFDHNLHPFYLVAGLILMALWGVHDKRYTIFSLICYLVILTAEFLLYMYDGHNFKNEENYYYYLAAFVGCLLIGKKWNGSK